MAEHALTPQLALQIGLAAKALPDSDIRHLTAALIATVGLPLTAAKLESLQPKDLKRNLSGSINDADLRQIIAYLRGEAQHDPTHDAPQPKSYSDGELPGSVRVACASNHGERFDGHFGSCSRFLVYQVCAQEIRLIDVRAANDAQSEEDKNTYRSGLIRDCDLVYVTSIGGPAAAKVVKAGILPIKQPQEISAQEMLIKLQQRLSGNPPP